MVQVGNLRDRGVAGARQRRGGWKATFLNPGKVIKAERHGQNHNMNTGEHTMTLVRHDQVCSAMEISMISQNVMDLQNAGSNQMDFDNAMTKQVESVHNAQALAKL